MNKEINIEAPNGFEIDKSKSTFRKIVFKAIVIKQSAEERMREIWRKCNIVKYSSDNCRTYFMDNTPMIQQDWDNKRLYYNYTDIYLIFKNDYSMSENDINKLVIDIVSKDLNCNSMIGQGRMFDWVVFN